ncbi:MAG: benzoate/H(+) symporter BenE family transporter [Burkholderiales bacterium]|nr:benzoate/H(+) symporter BenE family transporter [Burkholderiales bacterium]
MAPAVRRRVPDHRVRRHRRRPHVVDRAALTPARTGRVGGRWRRCPRCCATRRSPRSSRGSLLVVAVAGLALLPTIGSALGAAVRDEAQREAAIVTFLGTASGVTLAGIGAAFRGLCAAALTLAVLAPRRRA